MLDFIKNTLTAFKDVFQLSGQALNDFLNVITEQITMAESMKQSILSGGIPNLNLLKFMGAFRWLVGDVIWFMFYAIIMFGLWSTIYYLILMIKTNFFDNNVLGKVRNLFLK